MFTFLSKYLHQFNLFFAFAIWNLNMFSGQTETFRKYVQATFRRHRRLGRVHYLRWLRKMFKVFAVGFFVEKTIFWSKINDFGLNLAKRGRKSPLEHQNLALKTLVKFWNRALKTLRQNLKSGSQNPYLSKPKPWNRALKTLSPNPKP